MLGVELEHPAAVYLASLSLVSRSTMGYGLRVATAFWRSSPAAWRWQDTAYVHVAALRSWMVDRYAPASARLFVAALRGTLRTCVRMGLMTEAAARAALDIPPIRGSRVPPGRMLAAEDLSRMLAACGGDDAQGLRDRALLVLLTMTGVRRDEVRRLELEHFDAGAGELLVHGKGRKQRLVPLASAALAELAPYLAARRALGAGALIVRVRGGELTTDGLGHSSVYHLLRRIGDRAGVERFQPHDFRRTFISNLWDAGVAGPTIQELVGHADLSTTARYDRRGARARREAVELLTVPRAPQAG